MAEIKINKTAAAGVETPLADKVSIFVDSADGKLKYKDEDGNIIIATNEATLSDTGVAGESISIGDSLYLHTDGKLYKTDATDVAKLPDMPRIAKNAAAVDEPVAFDFQGISKHLTGLTPNRDYYITNTPGTIGLTPGTNRYFVGNSINDIEIKLFKNDIVPIAGTDKTLISSTAGAATSSGTYTKLKSTTVLKPGTYTVSYTITRTAGTGSGVGNIFNSGIAVGTETNGGTGDAVAVSGSYFFDMFDTIEVWARVTGGGATFTVTNFLVRYSDGRDLIGYNVFSL